MRTLIIARLSLKIGMHDRYAEIFGNAVAPALEARELKLVGAYFPMLGDTSEVTHIWEAPDANAFIRALGNAMTDDERFRSALPDLTECIVSEHMSVMTDAPYARAQ
jgi:hypothetical protein